MFNSKDSDPSMSEKALLNLLKISLLSHRVDSCIFFFFLCFPQTLIRGREVVFSKK